MCKANDGLTHLLVAAEHVGVEKLEYLSQVVQQLRQRHFTGTQLRERVARPCSSIDAYANRCIRIGAFKRGLGIN
jgi:hypothetical protein